MAAQLRAVGRAGGARSSRSRRGPTPSPPSSPAGRCCAALGHAGPVFAATSRYHLPRCLLLLRLAGVPARPVPIGASGNGGLARRWYWRLREVPAIPYDAALMLWERVRGR